MSEFIGDTHISMNKDQLQENMNKISMFLTSKKAIMMTGDFIETFKNPNCRGLARKMAFPKCAHFQAKT